MKILHNATIVTADKEAVGTVVIEDNLIKEVLFSDSEDYEFRTARLLMNNPKAEVMELSGKWMMAGGIDAHVHFREPGLTHKADMETESRAAAAGGVTTVFDMPNTNPPTTTSEALKEKLKAAEGRSVVNIGFHIGATNGNSSMIAGLVSSGDENIRSEDIAGVKVFMGSSTGNMLVDESETLDRLFSIIDKPVLVQAQVSRFFLS